MDTRATLDYLVIVDQVIPVIVVILDSPVSLDGQVILVTPVLAATQVNLVIQDYPEIVTVPPLLRL